MKEQILAFGDQLRWRPVVENRSKLGVYKSFLVLGMGGSGLAGRLLKSWHPEIDVTIRNDYGLPAVIRPDTLIIASSYSGNTVEVITGAKEALEKNLPLAIIYTGGQLVDFAKNYGLPFVELPDWELTPRMAIGLSLKALVKIVDSDRLAIELEHVADKLKPSDFETEGKNLASQINGHIPLIYSSSDHSAFGYLLKIMLNETAKIPAFRGIAPEICHNEIEGFDVRPDEPPPFGQFKMIGLISREDNPEIKKQIRLIVEIYRKRGLPAFVFELPGTNPTEKIIHFCLITFWATLDIAETNQKNPEKTELIDELKSKI